jgi:hypothetical protein
MIAQTRTATAQVPQAEQQVKKKKDKRRIITQSREYIEFDYLADTSISYSRIVKHGTQVGIRVKNINKKLFTIDAKFTETNYNETKPVLFETFDKTKLPQPPDPGNGMSGNNFESTRFQMQGNSELLQKIDDIITQVARLSSEIKNQTTIIQSFITNYNRIKTILSYHQEIIDLQNSCSDSLPILLKTLAETTDNNFRLKNLDIGATEKGILQKRNYALNAGVIKTVSNNTVSEAENDYAKMEAGFIPSKVTSWHKRADAIVKALDELNTQARASRVVNNELVRELRTLKENYTCSDDIADLEDLHNRINPGKLLSDISAFKAKGISDLLKTYNGFNEAEWTFEVSPEKMKSDENEFKISILPKENLQCTPLKRTYQVEIRPGSGLKIDFSSGFFANFGGNDFKDQGYHYDSIPSEPGKYKIVRNRNQDVLFPSIGALMHIYRRTGREFNWSGSFGISTKDLEKINYHVGGSLIFGYSQRFVLSAGVTLTRAVLLDNKYEVGQLIDKAGAPDVIPTGTYNRIGFFASFTYNLTARE